MIPLPKFILRIVCVLVWFVSSCGLIEQKENIELTAGEILGNPEYLAISYGGYRTNTRDTQPTIEELMEDLKILHAMNIRILRTYNTTLPHASNILKAIRQLKNTEEYFEMYVMLGAWIDCKNARTEERDHHREDIENNTAEIQQAVDLASQYPDIVKIIAVGNEAMVKWAESYYVQPEVILKWVNYLQSLKAGGKLPKDLWITSSDNFASWGGGDSLYHTQDLVSLIHAVDYISMHTYPMHDTHYNPDFWGIFNGEKHLTKEEKIHLAMQRSTKYAITQYENTAHYINSLGVSKPVHIGETGWASASNGFYGPSGSKATDEYKQSLYYHGILEWGKTHGISCFFFEAFDEVWKDAKNPGGSENHFGLFNLQGQAKYALWDLTEQGTFKGLGRGGNPVTKTYDGDKNKLMQEVYIPPDNINGASQ